MSGTHGMACGAATRPGVTPADTSNDAGVWTKTVIIDNAETDSASGVSADPAGNLHITYVDTLAHALMYSSNASGDWKSYPVDSSSFVQEKADITVGADGTVHIVYNGNTELRYATTSH